MSINLNDNQLNYIVNNELKFDSNSRLYKQINYPQPVVNFGFRTGKKIWVAYVYGITCMWGIGASYSIIKRKYVNLY